MLSMKLFIASLMVSMIACQTPTYSGAVAASYCMSVANATNSASNVNCSACLNWEGKARVWVSNSAACGAVLSTTAITDCQVYDGNVLATASQYHPSTSSCQRCKKSYYNVSYPNVSTSNSTVSCSSSKGTGCTGTIDECYQTKCLAQYSSSVQYSSQFCSVCNDGYQPAGSDIWNAGALKCVMGTTQLPNCSRIQANTQQFNSPTCMTCHKDFAVGSASAGCVGYTADENCRALNTSTSTYEGCISCFSAYYFSGSTCVLSSKLFAGLGFALLALLWFN